MKNHIDDKTNGINGGDCAPAEQSDIPSSPDQTDGAGNTREIIGTGKILPFQPDYHRRYSATHRYRDTDAGEKNAYFQGVIDVSILALDVSILALALYLVHKMVGK